MLASKRIPSSQRGRGYHRDFKSAITILALVSVQLLSMTSPAAAIGGWQSLNILLNRLSGERTQHEQDKKSPPIVPNGGGGGGNTNKKQEGGGGGEGEENKKRHVGEVTMTSNSNRGSSSAPSASDPAFVPQGRRGAVHLDENDVNTITFVGRSNPFL